MKDSTVIVWVNGAGFHRRVDAFAGKTCSECSLERRGATSDACYVINDLRPEGASMPLQRLVCGEYYDSVRDPMFAYRFEKDD